MAHKGEHKYRLATAHMALLCENGQGKKLACAAANRFSLPFVSLRYNTSAPPRRKEWKFRWAGDRSAETRRKSLLFDALIPPVIHPACNIPLQYTIAYVVFL